MATSWTKRSENTDSWTKRGKNAAGSGFLQGDGFLVQGFLSGTNFSKRTKNTGSFSKRTVST